MFKYLLTALSTVGLLALAPAPASAQPRVSFGLEIHIGNSAPPRAQREVRPHRPAHGFVWVAGAWAWAGNQWVWIDGRWERPERRGSTWIPARHTRYGHDWRYTPGHWSHQRVVEGADYRQWRKDRKAKKGGRHDNGRRPAKVQNRRPSKNDDRGHGRDKQRGHKKGGGGHRK